MGVLGNAQGTGVTPRLRTKNDAGREEAPGVRTGPSPTGCDPELKTTDARTHEYTSPGAFGMKVQDTEWARVVGARV